MNESGGTEGEEAQGERQPPVVVVVVVLEGGQQETGAKDKRERGSM